MPFISKLPSWSAFPISGGFGLVSIFAPDAFPEWLRIVLFWIGVVLLAVGVFAAAWHHRPKGWLTRNFWWRFRRSAPLPVTPHNPTIAPTQPRAERTEAWLPLHQALKYLIYHSNWAFEQSEPQTKEEFDQAVTREFCERLARGEVGARGVEGLSFSDSGGPTTKIPSDYWQTGFMRPFANITLAEEAHDAAGNSASHIHKTYRRVIISHDDLMEVWPKTERQSLSPLAAFVEPYRLKYEKESAKVQEKTIGDFGYAYPKAVLKAEIPKPKGTKTAESGQDANKMAIMMRVFNDHTATLANCEVILVGFAKDGEWTCVDKSMRVGKDKAFPIAKSQDKNFYFLSRDMTDLVTPEPFLLRLAETMCL